MTPNRRGDDVPMLIAAGAAVAVCASLAHEALGHGSGCIADGGVITLLTFLVFRCEGAGVLADAGGPAGAFFVGVACLTVLRLFRPKPSGISLFTYALGIQTMFWVFAQLAREGIDSSDDWGHVARDLGWAPGWHAAAIAVGLIGYALTIRFAISSGRPLAQGRPARLLIPYGATVTFAVILGGSWHGDRAASALDASLTFGVAPLGHLHAIYEISRHPLGSTTSTISRSIPWLLGVVIACSVYALTIARGVGRLA